VTDQPTVVVSGYGWLRSLPIEPGQAAVNASVVVTYALEAAGDGTVDPVP